MAGDKKKARDSSGKAPEADKEEEFEGLSLQQQKEMMQQMEKLQQENLLLNARFESFMQKFENLNLPSFSRTSEQGGDPNSAGPSSSHSHPLTTSPTPQPVSQQPKSEGGEDAAGSGNSATVTNTVISTSTTLMSQGAAGDNGRDDELEDIVAESKRGNLFVNSVMGEKQKKLVPPPALQGDDALPKGKSPFDFSDSSSSSSDDEAGDSSSNTVLSAMKSVIRAAKDKKKTKNFKTFEELSNWFIKRVMSMKDPSAQLRYFQLLKTLLQLSKEVGVGTTWKYLKKFLKKDHSLQRKSLAGESVQLLAVDSYDPNIFATVVLPSVLPKNPPPISNQRRGNGRGRGRGGSNGDGCWICGSANHFSRNCPKKEGKEGEAPSQTRSSGGGSRGGSTARNDSRCSKCGGTRHAASACPSA